MPKIKISHIISDSNVGGAGVLLSSLSRALSQAFDLSIFIPKGARLAASLERSGARVYKVPMASDRSFRAGDVQGFYSVFRSFRPDIVHTHGALSARLGARLAGIKSCLSTRHCAIPAQAVKRKSGIARGVYDFCTDFTVSTADYATDNLICEGVPERKIITIRNGVSKKARSTPEQRRALRASLGIGERDRVIGICARLEWVKGIDIAISALPDILKSIQNAFLVIVGEGACRDALTRQSARLGIMDRVKFCGFKDDPTPYQSIFDINLNCSRGTETSCLATSECMSMGIPTVASDFGGNREMIVPYENGVLFRCDDPFSLAEAITELLTDGELLTQLSRGAEEHFAKHFSLERMTADYSALYERAFREHRPCPMTVFPS